MSKSKILAHIIIFAGNKHQPKTSMKKLPVLLFVLLHISAHAQRLHINAGAILSKLDREPYGGVSDALLNFSGGLGITYLNHPKVDMTTSLNYLQKGGKEVIYYNNPLDNSIYSKNVKSQLSYIVLSNSVRLKFKGKKTIPYATTGLNIGYLLSANQYFDQPAMYKFNIGGIAGLGVMFKVLKNDYGVQLCYFPSFNKLSDRLDDYTDAHFVVKDQVLGLTLYTNLKLK